MVNFLAAALTLIAQFMISSMDIMTGGKLGFMNAICSALILGSLPLLLLYLLRRLLSRVAQGRFSNILTTARPILQRLVGWSAFIMAIVPLFMVIGGTGSTVSKNGVWCLAWTWLLIVGLGIIWLILSLAQNLQNMLDTITRQTASPYDDIVAELCVRIGRGVLPIIIASTLIHAMAAHLGNGSPWAGLAVVGCIAWSLLQVVAMLDRLLLARMDLNSADNLAARRMATQVTVIKKIMYLVVAVLGLAAVLMQFEAVRQIGTSIFASVGLLSMVIGLAAQRTLSNLLAGIQIALTQPIRLDDVVVIDGEWGRIEEITLTYVVVGVWDQRRLIVPISQLIDKPFQNWTRNKADILGTVFLHCDYRVQVESLRTELQRLVENDARWDKRVANVQVTDANEHTVQIRALVSSADSSKNWDLRCAVREGLLMFLQKNQPDALPRLRVEQSAQVIPAHVQEYRP